MASAASTIKGSNLGFAERVETCDPVAAPAGIRLTASSGNTIQNTLAQLTGFGIVLSDADDNLVRSNGAAPSFSDGNVCGGIALVGSDHNRLIANTVAMNRSGDAAVGDGISVDAASHHNVLKANVGSTNSGDGIDVASVTTKLVRNSATGNDQLGLRTVVGVTASDNRASGNGDPLFSA